MDALQIKGGNKLQGEIAISGAKNSVLKLMCASLMTDAPVTLHNVPSLADVTTLSNLLTSLGCQIKLDGDASAKREVGNVIQFHTPDIPNPRAEYDLVRKMRASITVLGPLLGRCGRAEVSLPGGCAIGARPIDQHQKAIEALGATVTIENGYVIAQAPEGGLRGAPITLDFVTVGGTECAMLAAVLADGVTTITPAAREPEIVDLAEFLGKMGAKIEGAGTDTITITGVDKLHGAEHHVIVDRIETGSYAIAAAITQGDVFLRGARRDLFASCCAKLEQTGVTLTQQDDGLRVQGPQKLKPLDVDTAPFPGYATDLQAQMMTLMCCAAGTSTMTENVFENRFMHVPELVRMGADITVNGRTAVVKGGKPLSGAPVMASDLRASMALVLAGLVSGGETIVNRIYHLDRGYELLEEKLRSLGADITRISQSDAAA